MGFLGISGNTWKKVGKIALKAAPIVAAPFTGGASLLALGAGTGALSGALGGGGWKGALTGAALGAIPGGGTGGAVAGGVKGLATGLAKGAATNFATGTATGLATGQGVKQSLKGGGESALSGLGTQGTGGFGQAAKTVGKNVAMNAGGALASRGLQQAGVPGGIAAQGGNVFSNYMGKQFTPGATSFAGPSGAQPPLRNFLPQGATSAAPTGGAPTGGAPTGGGGWKDAFLRAGTGALGGALGGGGVRGALTGATTALRPQGGGGGQPGGGGGGFSTDGGYGGGGRTEPTFPGGGSPGPGGGAGAGGTGAADPGGEWQGAPVPPGYTPPERPATWAERYGPLIAQGAGVVTGALVGRQAQQNAMNRSPEEQAALAGAQGAAKQSGQLGGQLAQQGRDYLQKPGEYFQTLLGGNRAAMSQAVAAPTAQLTGVYRGAQRNLDQQGIRGAARDVAAGDLNRDRASKIAGLTTGVQPYAAEQLAKMGQDTLSQAPSLLNTSGNIYGNLLGKGQENRKYARDEGASTAKAIGGLARDAGEVVFKRPQAGGTSTPDKPTQGGPPPKKPVAGQPTPAPGQNGPTLQTIVPPTPFPFGGLPGTGAGTLNTPGDYDPNRQIWT